MSLIYLNDLDKVCRGCLGKNGEMRPLFGSYLDNMLRMVAEIEVRVGDGLPQMMCVPCVLQVSRAFTFKQQCQRSDTTLRTFFQEMEKSSNDVANLAIDLNAVRAIETPKELLDVVEGNVIGVTDSTNQMEIEMVPEQIDTVKFDNSSPEMDNLQEKCLLIVHSVPQTLMADNITGSMNLEDENGISSTDGTFVSTNDLIEEEQQDLDGNSASAGIMVEEMDNEMADQQLNIELMTDQFEFDEIKKDDDVEPTILSEKPSKVIGLFRPRSQDARTFCNECNILFDTKQNYKSHRQKLHSTFQCNVCDKVFAENKILKRHLKIHNPNKPHVCNVCMMSFAESSNLTKHMKKHTGELRNVIGKPNLCSVCGKGFKWASSLSKHMKHHTKHKILNCPYCPKYYVEARSLNIHLRSHTGEKPFVCDICKKAFTQLGNLEKHIRVHTGEKPYECPICKKAFSQSGYVAIHLRTHTGERPYLCGACGKSFASSNTLAIHKRTHTGERPYSCNICNKSFARQETVIIHQRTHTGERPHVCTICNRGFASSGHLTGHMRSHTGEKTHECPSCGKKLAGSSSLKVHMKIHEKTDEATLDDNAKLTTIYKCNVCNQNVTFPSFEHEIIDSVLMCSNLASLMEAEADSGDLSDNVPNDDTDLILSNDLADGTNSQVIINLSGLKEEIF